MTAHPANLAIATYSRARIAGHWLVALGISATFAIPLLTEGMAKADRRGWMTIHKAVGLLILMLALLWVWRRVTSAAVGLTPGIKPWEAVAARLTHATLFFLMVGIPLTGWLMMSAEDGGTPIDLFGLIAWPGLPIAKDDALAKVFEEIHKIVAFTGAGVVALHVAGALKHAWGDGYFRMWPRPRDHEIG